MLIKQSRIRNRYLIAVGVIALMALTGFLLLNYIITEQGNSARIINISGKQRMLSQRIALNANLFVNAPSPEEAHRVRSNLLDDINDMKDGHLQLAYNDGPINTHALHGEMIDILFFHKPTLLDRRIRDYLAQAEFLAAQPHDMAGESQAILNMLILQSGELLPDLNQIVTQYEWEAEKNIAYIDTLEAIVFLTTMIVLLIEVLFIFRPMERQIIRSQRKLMDALQRAESSERLKSQFMANMSHELRTPMNGIVGTVELLDRTELQDRQKRLVELIDQSSKELLVLINDVLDFSRLETGNIDLENHPFDLQAVIQEAVSEKRFALDHKHLDCDVVFSENSQFRFVSDAVHLKKIITHLLDNAIKFTEKGSISIHTAVYDSDIIGCKQVTIEIKDTGIGISADKLESIFDDFVQADGSTTRSYQGTGLGLAICKRIILALGGNLSVTSEVGKGTCFTLSLALEPVSTVTEVKNDQHQKGLSI